jgi:hypothetical protein
VLDFLKQSSGTHASALVVLNSGYVDAGYSPRFKTQCLLFKLSLVSHLIYNVNVFLLTSIYFFLAKINSMEPCCFCGKIYFDSRLLAGVETTWDVISRNDCTQNKIVKALRRKKGFQFGANVKTVCFVLWNTSWGWRKILDIEHNWQRWYHSYRWY